MVVCTAAVPGRPAPKIISAAMVAGMKPGSVIVDLAAETGGNCELTRPGETVEHGGVSDRRAAEPASQGAAARERDVRAQRVQLRRAAAARTARWRSDWDDELLAKTVLAAPRAALNRPPRA